MADRSPFVSLCHLLALPSFPSALCLLLSAAGWRQGGKPERVRETDGEEKKDEEDEDGGEGGRVSHLQARL